MKRTIFFELKKWKEDQRRKPLLIRGARQVGKYRHREARASNAEVDYLVQQGEILLPVVTGVCNFGHCDLEFVCNL